MHVMSSSRRGWRVLCGLIILITCAMFVVAPGRTVAQTTPCAASGCKIFLPTVITPQFTAVTGSDTDLFAAAGSSIIRFDRTNPTQPALRERLTLPDASTVTRLFYIAPVLYVVQLTSKNDTFSTTLTLVTWQAGIAPQIRGHYTFAYSASIALDNGLAYVASGDVLSILDIHDPDHSTVLSTLQLGANNGGDVAVKDQTVYVAGSLYLTVVDARDPARPHVAVRPTLPSMSIDAVVDGNLLYVPLYHSSAQVWDIHTPRQPRLLKTTFDSLPLLAQLSTDGTYIYDAGLSAYDRTSSRLEVFVRDTTSEELPSRGGIDLPAVPTGVFARDGIAYVPTDRAGLLIIDVRPPERPRIVGSLGL